MAAAKTSVKSAPAESGRGQAQGLPGGRAEVSSGSPRVDLAQARQRPDPASGHPDPLRGRAARRRPVRQLSQSQPAVSHHLALLRHGGIIAPRRQGKNNFYSLTDTGTDLARVVKNLIA